jgi:predicted methyltransferase
MAINLTGLIQKNLGYPALLKMDANTQEVVIDSDQPAEERFSQAAIPAVLIALYKFTRADETAEMLLYNGKIGDWMTVIHNGNAEKVIKAVANYASQPTGRTWERMNAIAGEAVRLIKDAIGTGGTAMDVKTLMADQRNYILPYLPAGMQLGALLNDSTLDDRTNKMQGPVSGLMHFIGNQLAGSDISKDA